MKIDISVSGFVHVETGGVEYFLTPHSKCSVYTEKPLIISPIDTTEICEGVFMFESKGPKLNKV